jgi:hypothetical protein
VRRRFPGRANREDARWSIWIEPAELPWPLRFDFVVVDNNGTQEWMCFGFEAGGPVRPDEERELDDYVLGMKQVSIIFSNFHQYEKIARELLLGSDSGRDIATKTRRAMTRRSGGALDPVYLAGLVAEWRALEGEPTGRMWELATKRRINRHHPLAATATRRGPRAHSRRASSSRGCLARLDHDPLWPLAGRDAGLCDNGADECSLFLEREQVPILRGDGDRGRQHLL